MMNYERHPISGSWPDMLQKDFEVLKDSINVSGLREPIVLFEGMILDGWHRYNACLQTGAVAEFEEFTEDDPIQYVQDKHTRRPLTLTQRMTAIALMHSWKSRGKPSKSALNADLTSAQLAKAAGGSVRTAEQVKEAITKGSAALVDGMKSGKTSAVKAAAVAKLPKREQAAAIDKPLPKPAPKPEPEHDDGMLTEDELIAEMQETQAENKQLQERVDLMASDDKAAEIDKLLTRINGLEGRINQLMMQVKSSADGEKYHAAVIHKLRKLLGVEGHKEIIAAVVALVADRRLAA